MIMSGNDGRNRYVVNFNNVDSGGYLLQCQWWKMMVSEEVHNNGNSVRHARTEMMEYEWYSIYVRNKR